MVKSEALQAMMDGHKVTHQLFSEGEYIIMLNRRLYDEEGYNVSGDFWMLKIQPEWQTGWYVCGDCDNINDVIKSNLEGFIFKLKEL